jgi:hypothetical protein
MFQNLLPLRAARISKTLPPTLLLSPGIPFFHAANADDYSHDGIGVSEPVQPGLKLPRLTHLGHAKPHCSP